MSQIQKVYCKVTHNSRGEELKPHWAMHGQQVCRVHGGRAKQNKRKALERIEEAKVRKVLASWDNDFAAGKLGEGQIETDPTQTLMRLMEKAAWNVATIEAKVQELRMGRGQKNPETDEYEPGLWTYVPEVGDIPTPWVRMYNEERDRLAKYSMDCIKAGVAEIMVRTATDTVQRFIDALEASWERLGLTPEQKESERKLIAKQLQERRHIAKDLMRDAG